MYNASWVDYIESESKWTSLLPLPFLQPAWFLMVGGDRSFKLALTEKDKEFSDELRKDCEVRGMERSGREGEGRVGTGRGSPISGDGQRWE